MPASLCFPPPFRLSLILSAAAPQPKPTTSPPGTHARTRVRDLLLFLRRNLRDLLADGFHPTMTMVEAEAGREAIRRALRSLRRRHLVEEGAHRPAIEALARPFAAQAVEWKEKAEKHELELQQCYKAQSRLSEQLVTEIEEGKASKALLKEKETLLTTLQNELEKTREENMQLKQSLEEKTRALDLLIQEHQAVKAELEQAVTKQKVAEDENRNLIDRWMLEKMKDAERLNEANAMYEEMALRLKSAGVGGIGGIQYNALQETDGIIRRSEAGYMDIMKTPIPSTCKITIRAHDGGCGSIIFQHNTDKLISGGQDQTVKIWSAHTGALTSTLQGCLGSVNDLAVTNDNKFVIAACSSNKLFVWEVNGGRPRHTLTGHTKNVSSVDASWVKSCVLASSSADHTIKIWDLQTGFCKSTIMSGSTANSLAFIDGDILCSGHRDGHLRLWDIRSGKCTSQTFAHLDVSSVCVSRSKNFILTSGKDNVHNLFDLRTMEVCGKFKAMGNRVVGSWGRPCISPDENSIAAGANDGSVYIWSRLKRDGVPTILQGHSSSVFSSAWCGLGPLATADKNHIYIWT